MENRSLWLLVVVAQCKLNVEVHYITKYKVIVFVTAIGGKAVTFMS